MTRLHIIDNRGFAAWEMALLVAFLVGIGIVGMRIYDATNPAANNQSVATTGASKAATTTAAASPVTTPAAPLVNNTADLTDAENTINQINPATSNASDASQLNTLANF